MNWNAFKESMLAYRNSSQKRVTTQLEPRLCAKLSLMLALTTGNETGAAIDQSAFKWRNESLLLYVVISATELISFGSSRGYDSVLMSLSWLKSACEHCPRHRIVLVQIDVHTDKFSFIGLTQEVHALSHLALAQPARCARSFYAHRDIVSSDTILLPSAYIDPSPASIYEELTARPLTLTLRPAAAAAADAAQLIVPNLSLSSLQRTVMRGLTADDSSAYVLDWFNSRMLAILNSDGRLHTKIVGEEDVSFALVLFCVIARCTYSADGHSLLRTRALSAFLNFEMYRLSAQLFRRCITSVGTAEMLASGEPAVRAIAERGFSIQLVKPADVHADVLLALDDCNRFFVRGDASITHVFCYDSALALQHTMTSKRGVLFGGKLYLTYHDVPHVLSELYTFVLEKLVCDANERFNGELPSFLTPFTDKCEFFECAFETARERFLRIHGKRVALQQGAAVVLPDVEDLATGAAPLCMVNSLSYLKSQGRLPHHSRVLIYRHLLDAGYSSSDVEAHATKHVNGDDTLKDHRALIQFEEKNMERDHERKCGCAMMLSAKFDRDKDSRGCPYKEHDEENLAALLLESGMDANDPALTRIINKAVGHGDVQGIRHPRAACAMHATARIRAAIGPQPYSTDGSRGLPFDSPAGFVHYVLASIQRPATAATSNMTE